MPEVYKNITLYFAHTMFNGRPPTHIIIILILYDVPGRYVILWYTYCYNKIALRNWFALNEWHDDVTFIAIYFRFV